MLTPPALQVVDILYGIFSPSEGNALCSVKDLLVLPFFADVEIKEVMSASIGASLDWRDPVH